ncbi:MAG TPA: antibiotic biosynthesis monooxygenase [Acidimicrobiia bacterium]|nr:antibiotic biosynthesis monooxygenase [Acidimicrobiia bacterium]
MDGDDGDPLGGRPAEPETAIVTMVFDTTDPDALLGALSKYVVLTRGEPGCRNVDLCGSSTRPNRLVVVQKWVSEAVARAHFDSPLTVEMATACDGILAAPPDIDILVGLSAHDWA